jgi:hypothetical protein
VTDDEIAAAQARCDAATEGPWLRGWWGGQAEAKCRCSTKGDLLAQTPQTDYPGAGPYHRHVGDFHADAHRISSSAEAGCLDVAGTYDYEVGGILDPADAEFIAHARTDLPQALRALRGARLLIASLRETVDQSTKERDDLLDEVDQLQQTIKDNVGGFGI